MVYKTNLLVFIAALMLMALVGCAGSPPAASSIAPTTAVATGAPATDVPAETVTDVDTLVTTSCTKLNLNELTEAQLLSTIPDFSNRMVREFFEYRPYVSIQQFRREIGKYVDETTIATYEQYVYVPVDVNESDADTVMQMPGVDATIANALIAGRPYADNAAFLAVLDAQVDADTLANAACYLAS